VSFCRPAADRAGFAAERDVAGLTLAWQFGRSGSDVLLIERRAMGKA
jgi:hypothetical protein